MALITCSHCGKQMSDRADVCPHCGVINKEKIEIKQNRERKDSNTVIALMSCIFLFFIFFCCLANPYYKSQGTYIPFIKTPIIIDVLTVIGCGAILVKNKKSKILRRLCWIVICYNIICLLCFDYSIFKLLNLRTPEWLR